MVCVNYCVVTAEYPLVLCYTFVTNTDTYMYNFLIFACVAGNN